MKTELAPQTTYNQRQAILEFDERLHRSQSDRIVTSILIGSVARGAFTGDSDIDILVAAERADTEFKSDVWGIGSDVSLEHNVVFNVHIYSHARWDRMRRENSALWQAVQREGIELTPELSRP